MLINQLVSMKFTIYCVNVGRWRISKKDTDFENLFGVEKKTTKKAKENANFMKTENNKRYR